MSARMGMAEKLSIQQLTKAVQDGTVPSYIGIPLIQQKMKEQQGAAPMQPMAPPVAQQVMQQAMQGVPALPSNMPEEYAQGGILSYADGGDIYDDSDEDYNDQVRNQEEEDLMDELLSNPEMYAGESAPGIESLREVKVSPSGKSFEAKETKVQMGNGTSENLLKHILHKESRGQRYDKEGNLLTSSKGALGEMQVMPATARDPGFGIAPARNNDPEELRRVGEQYAKVLLNKYQDPKLAAIAYNMGPGNTDKWLAAGADMSKLPQETRGYIQGMAEGGITGFAGGGAIKGFADGSLIEIPDTYRSRTPSATEGSIKSEAEKLLAEARARAAQRAAERVAASSAASAAPSTPAAPSSPAAMSPFEKYIKPMFSAGSLRSAAANPAGIATLGGGSLLSAGAANALSNATPEQREQLMGDIGSDTGLAAAIMNASTGPKPPAPAKPYDFTQFDAATDRYMKEREAKAAPVIARAPDTSPDNIDAVGGQNFGVTQATAQTAPTEQAAQANPISGIEQLLAKREAGLGKQRDIDNYMSLLSAGLGMMGGTSPFAAANIGQGAQAGVKTFADAQARRVAEENAILSGRLGAFKYAGDRERAAELMALRKQMGEANLGLGKERLAQSVKEHEAGRVAKTEAKQLDYINRAEEKALTAATKLVADNPNSLSMTDAQKADSIKAMTNRLLMANKNYRVFHQGYYGADPFPNISNTMSSDRAAQFKVER
jgi:soluble lytic murein transglycosylase-like protein